MKINPIRLGLIFGVFLALFHACWVTLVALGWAQGLMDFIFWAHFITPPYHVQPFEISQAAALIGFVFLVGLVSGIIGGLLWNRLVPAD